MQEMDLIQICLFPSSISLYVYWQSRPLHEWPDLCLSECCSQRFKMSGLPCVWGAAVASPSPSFCPSSSPRPVQVLSLYFLTVFSHPWLSEIFRLPSEGELLQGAEGQLGDQQQHQKHLEKEVLRI